MTNPDDYLRAHYARRTAWRREVADRLTGHADARAMLADAMSRDDNQEGTEHASQDD